MVEKELAANGLFGSCGEKAIRASTHKTTEQIARFYLFHNHPIPIMTSTAIKIDQVGVTDDAQEGVEQLLETAKAVHTKPLWTEMTRLNPPMPNPKCGPHIWEYDKIRPSLLKASQLVSEKQAERRVLMLVNPSRGTRSIEKQSRNGLLGPI